MRVLVIANCPWKAYYNYLHGMKPDWDVRASVMEQAVRWLDSGHEGFLTFLDQVDLVLGTLTQPSVQRLMERVPDSAIRITVPSFRYSGYQPDTVWVGGIDSLLGRGDIHSRIALAAFLGGRSRTEARQLFNGRHYAACGFMDALESERDRVIRNFARDGLDLAPAFTRWAANGNFLHAPNHPQTPVFLDIAHLAMGRAGLTQDMDPRRLAALRADFPDYLSESILWPLYPEIAEHHQIPVNPRLWREPLAIGGREFGLDEMLARSWAIFSGLSDEARQKLRGRFAGGAAEIARLAAA